MTGSDNIEAALLMDESSASGRIRVWKNAAQVWLCIDDVEQSRIDIRSPHVVQSPVHRAFLLPLLFIDIPRKVMLVGLGGGVIVNALQHIAPSIEGDAIEIEPLVVEAARKYFYLSENNWRIHMSDIRDWEGPQQDLIYVDIADDDSTPDWLVSTASIEHFKGRLTDNGVLLINLLVEDSERFRDILIRLRSAFDNRTVCIGFDDHWNIVVMCFRSAPTHPADQMEARCAALHMSSGCDLTDLVARMLKDNPPGSGVL